MLGKDRTAWTKRVAAVLGLVVPVAIVPVLGAQSASAAVVYEVAGYVSVPNPGYVAVDDVTDTIYVDSVNNIYVIDGTTNTLETLIPVLSPGPIDVNPVTDTVYVASQGTTIEVINGATNLVTASIPVTTGDIRVTGVAVNSYINTIYVGADNVVDRGIDGNGLIDAIDGSTNTVTHSNPEGPDGGPDGAGGPVDQLAIDPATNTIFSVDNFIGFLRIIDGSTWFTTSDQATIDVSAMAMDSGTDTLYATDYISGSHGQIDVFPVASLSSAFAVPSPGAPPQNIADDSVAQRAFMTDGTEFWVFDTSVNAFEGGLSVPGAGHLAVDPATGIVYVASAAGLTIIAPHQTGTIIGDQPLPQGKIGTGYTGTLQATGGGVPYTWSVISGALPAGLALNPATGQITGTPVAPGTAIFTVQATDSAHPAVSATRTELLGGLTAKNAATLAVCGTTISGAPSSVTGATGYVLLGGSGDDGTPPCAGNTISGGLTLAGTTDGAELGGDTLTGTIQVTSNTGLTPAPERTGLEIEGNAIAGTLACTGNSPAPVNDHQPNHGSYTATGQCTGL